MNSRCTLAARFLVQRTPDYFKPHPLPIPIRPLININMIDWDIWWKAEPVYQKVMRPKTLMQSTVTDQ